MGRGDQESEVTSGTGGATARPPDPPPPLSRSLVFSFSLARSLCISFFSSLSLSLSRFLSLSLRGQYLAGVLEGSRDGPKNHHLTLKGHDPLHPIQPTTRNPTGIKSSFSNPYFCTGAR